MSHGRTRARRWRSGIAPSRGAPTCRVVTSSAVSIRVCDPHSGAPKARSHEFPTTVRRLPESSVGRSANRCPAVALSVTCYCVVFPVPLTGGIGFTVPWQAAAR